MGKTSNRLAFTLVVLFFINLMNFYDRQAISVVGEQIRKEFELNDKALGLLGTVFVLLYALVGVPLGRLADVSRRKYILAAGVTLWSALTALSAAAWSFPSLIVFRLGVGVGEASCAPAANSLLGDLFPRESRAKAIAFFMLGLPIGLALAFIISGIIADTPGFGGWRASLLIAGIPGLFLGVLSLWIPEPARGASETHAIGAARRQGSPLLAVLRIPTMWWIIASGAFHNFNMYALNHFLVPFIKRYHELSTSDAGWIGGLVNGVGGLTVLFGGWLCDRIVKRRVSGRLEVATVAMFFATPCIFMALQQAPGSTFGLTGWLLGGYAMLYFYYSGVYATIQDIVEPSLRGTAMAMYFFAMYLLGGALGPYVVGWTSDYYAERTAAELSLPRNAPEVIATGLHDAMYLVPIVCTALVIVLFIASRTVAADYRKYQQWASREAGDESQGEN